MAAGAGARGHGVGVRGRACRARQARRGRAGARGRQGMDAWGRAAGAGARGRRAGGRARQASAGRARRTAWARGLGVPVRAWCTGWASLGLMQPVWVLTWVFDSVVFLSHRLDSVHEHCSLQKIFRKKKKRF